MWTFAGTVPPSAWELQMGVLRNLGSGNPKDGSGVIWLLPWGDKWQASWQDHGDVCLDFFGDYNEVAAWARSQRPERWVTRQNGAVVPWADAAN